MTFFIWGIINSLPFHVPLPALHDSTSGPGPFTLDTRYALLDSVFSVCILNSKL